MQAEARIRTVRHHELILPLGAHHSEVSRAVSVAVEGWERGSTRRLGDVTVTADDTHLIISYQSLVDEAVATEETPR